MYDYFCFEVLALYLKSSRYMFLNFSMHHYYLFTWQYWNALKKYFSRSYFFCVHVFDNKIKINQIMQYRREFVTHKSNEQVIRENYIWYDNHYRKKILYEYIFYYFIVWIHVSFMAHLHCIVSRKCMTVLYIYSFNSLSYSTW